MPASRSARPRASAALPAASTAGSAARRADFFRLLRGSDPAASLLPLWPAGWALTLATGAIPPWPLVPALALGLWFAPDVGAALSRWIGARMDAGSEASIGRAQGERLDRTRLGLALSALAIAGVVLALVAPLPALWLALAALLMALMLPVVERHSYLAQALLGLATGWSVPLVFVAVEGEISALGWLLLCAATLWATAAHIWRAMATREDDRRRGVRSTAILLGDLDRVAQAMLHGAALVALTFVGQRAELGAAYAVGLGLAALLMGAQFWIARSRQRDACLRAFRFGNWVGAAVLLALVVGQVFEAR